jgi:nucleoside-diphosphate-sugar epimerase
MRHILLTGATGLIGGSLLDHWLSTRADCRFTIVSRDPPATRASSAECIRADIREPIPRLDAEKSITEIIHCAADTRFGLPLEEIRAPNVLGTHHLIEFAGRCPKLEKFAHISTVYVAGRSRGRCSETALRHSNGFCNNYEESKYEAESLVLNAMPRLPASIYRFSSILADSKTGKVHQFNYTHQLLRLFPRSMLSTAPGIPDAPVDLIASDWAVQALGYLIECGFAPGRIYHLCAGRGASLTVREMIDAALAGFESHAAGRRFLPIRVPELVTLDEYELFVAEVSRGKDALLKEVVRVLGFFLPHLALEQEFTNANTIRDLAEAGTELPPIREYFGKMVRYCLDTNWGRETRGLPTPQTTSRASTPS